MTRLTALAPKDLLETLNPFGSTFGRLFDDALARSQRYTEDGDRLLIPAVDLSEDESSFLVTAELPGLAKEDVRIQLENDVLTISGEKHQEKESKGKTWHRVERSYGAFHRAVSLPAGAASDKAEARFENGVLTIRVPKREDVKPRTIRIQ